MPGKAVIFGYMWCCLERSEIGNSLNPFVFDFRNLRVLKAIFQQKVGGGGRNRTGVNGFADRCLATWLHHQIVQILYFFLRHVFSQVIFLERPVISCVSGSQNAIFASLVCKNLSIVAWPYVAEV